MKYTRFRDIPMFTRAGQWQCNFNFDSVLRQLDQWGKEYGADYDPDFQREHVWTEAQQIAWLEFFFRGGRTGRTIYLNCPVFGGRGRSEKADDLRMGLVDGKQRLEAIRRFTSDEIRVFGSLWSEYTDSPDMVTQNLLINVNDLPTRAEIITWYIEMNAGGTPHTEAEIEKARKLLEAAK